jgi:hypothetical protein
MWFTFLFCGTVALAGRGGMFEKILFSCSDRYQNYQLYSINPDGTGLMQITAMVGAASSPTVSSDGRFITFTLDEKNSSNSALFTMNSDGSNLHQIYPMSGFAEEYISSPRYSKNDKSILFVSSVKGIRAVKEITLVNGKASFIRKKADIKSTSFKLMDNGDILFSEIGILKIKSDGSGIEKISVKGDNPDISKDGRIVYHGGDRYDDIFLRNIDGKVTQLTDNKNCLYDAVFSPDGTKVAMCGYSVAVKADYYHMIGIVNTDGTGYHDIIDNLPTRPVDTFWAVLATNTSPISPGDPWDNYWKKVMNPPQPDISASSKTNPAVIGVGKIDTKGEQVISSEITSKRFAVYYLSVKNIGDLPDRFNIKADFNVNKRNWTMKIFDKNGNDATFNFNTDSGYYTPEIPGGDSYDFRLEVSPSSSLATNGNI